MLALDPVESCAPRPPALALALPVTVPVPVMSISISELSAGRIRAADGGVLPLTRMGLSREEPVLGWESGLTVSGPGKLSLMLIALGW